LLAEEAAPPGPVDDDAAPPLLPPVLLEAAPPGLDEDAPPGLEELMPPVLLDAPPLVLPVPLGVVVELELLEPGLLGVVVVDDDDDEPPGTTMVSFSFTVRSVVGPGPPPGITVVVSLRSHAESARAPARTNK
jgi:hypothetical protein